MQMQHDHPPQSLSHRPHGGAVHNSGLAGVTRSWSRVTTQEQVVLEPPSDAAAWEDTEIDVRRLVL